MNDTIKFLDMAAYNCPDVVPQEIKRNDQVLYRLYFHFMCCLYRLHSAGADIENLKKFKNDFVNDFFLCESHFKAALKSCREQNRLNAALMDCRNNSENCNYCKAVSRIVGAPTAENEPDIEVS